MKLFVLGGTGGTGLNFIPQAIERGHTVTAVVRSRGKLADREGLRLVEGSVFDSDALADAMAGHDVVLTALGPRDLKPTTIRTDSTRALITAMQSAGLDRLVVVSAALLFPNMGLVGAVLNVILRNGMRDARTADDMAAASPLAWTIARPPRLTNGARRDRYRTAVDGLPEGGSSISRADLVRALLDIIEQRAQVRKIVGISY